MRARPPATDKQKQYAEDLGAGSSAVRSASTARAKGPASSRRSSRRPEALVFEARTRTRSCPARAVGVMSPQTRLAISDRRNPAQNANATIAASRRPRAAATEGVSRPRPRRWGLAAARIRSSAVA